HLRPLLSFPTRRSSDLFRALDLALEILKQRGLTDNVAVELNMGTQSADRMVGEPTTPTQFYFDAFRKIAGKVVDSTPLLNEARRSEEHTSELQSLAYLV